MSEFLAALQDLARDAGAWVLLLLAFAACAVGFTLLAIALAFVIAWPLSFVFDADVGDLAGVVMHLFVAAMIIVSICWALVDAIRDRMRRNRLERPRENDAR